MLLKTKNTKQGVNYPHGYRLVSVKTKDGEATTEYIQTPNYDKKLARVNGTAGVLHVYDSQERCTGPGINIPDIPDSCYTGYYGSSESETMIMLYKKTNNDYKYRFRVTTPLNSGHYELEISSKEGAKTISFYAGSDSDSDSIDIPISPSEVHQYTVDWDTLSKGGEGITVQIDFDGDGTFDQSINSDSLLTWHEYYEYLLASTALVYFNDFINQTEKKLYEFLIDSPITMATITGHWAGSKLELVAIEPGGRRITPDVADTDPDIEYNETSTSASYFINEPEPGEWHTEVTGVDIPEGGEPFNVSVIAESPIVSNFLPFDSPYDPGDVINIGVSLKEEVDSDELEPILNATVEAEVLRPDGQVNNLTLYDDGLHGDEDASDGIYANNYSNTNSIGSYLVKAKVHGSFERELKRTVRVGAFDAIYIAGDSLTPMPDSTIENTQPVISAVICGPAGNIDVGSINLKLDGNIVSHSYDNINQVVSYTPSAPLDGGSHSVDLALQDASGNPVSASWSFTIKVMELANLRAINYRFGEPTPGYNLDNFPIYKYWMNVEIENIREGDAFEVKASISSGPPNGTIVDADVTVGDVQAGESKWSTDTYTIELDLMQPGPGADQGITWKIEYEDSSGTPHVIEDVPEFPTAPALKRDARWFIVVPQTKLYQNYPNPWNPETWIPYQLSSPSDVMIKIYNIKGELIKSLDLGSKQPGFYISRDSAAYWNGRNQTGESVSSGIYFYQIEAGNFNELKKMVILK